MVKQWISSRDKIPKSEAIQSHEVNPSQKVYDMLLLLLLLPVASVRMAGSSSASDCVPPNFKRV